jgi:hypothetical protein
MYRISLLAFGDWEFMRHLGHWSVIATKKEKKKDIKVDSRNIEKHIKIYWDSEKSLFTLHRCST